MAPDQHKKFVEQLMESAEDVRSPSLSLERVRKLCQRQNKMRLVRPKFMEASMAGWRNSARDRQCVRIHDNNQNTAPN